MVLIGQKKIPMNPDEKSRENPPWTMFFEGPLYQKYDEYMKNHDFSKILQNKRLQLSSETSKATEKPQSKNSDPWENPEYDNVVPIASQFKVPSLDSYEYQEDKRRRRRRTCCFVCSGMLVIALLSLATALIIHYVFIIEPKEADLKTQVNVSVDGNDVEPKINSSLLNLHAGGSQSTTDDTSTTSSKETSPVTTTALKGRSSSGTLKSRISELHKIFPSFST